MRYLALASDYDGTIAHDGIVFPEVVDALKRLKASGRKLLLVTGRELEDLMRVFPEFEIFDKLVCENGALIYDPATKQMSTVGEPPPPAFVEELRRRKVDNISVGHVIVGTWHPHEVKVFETIRDMGLELQVIFNKGAVMILPPGVNKGSGLLAACEQLGLSDHNVVAAGDAENDHALLNISEFGVATANALPALKDRADFVTRADHGHGVMEVIELMLENDLADISPERHSVLLGTSGEQVELRMSPYGEALLVCGASGAGKTQVTMGILEQLARSEYQFCLIDPEGDYGAFDRGVSIGEPERAPAPDEVMNLLKKPSDNAIANLLGCRLEDRPAFFAGLLSRLQEMRTLQGRPHWIIVDEAHHLIARELGNQPVIVPQDLGGFILVTVHPEKLPQEIFKQLTGLIAVGSEADQLLQTYCKLAGLAVPAMESTKLEDGQALVWLHRSGRQPQVVKMVEADVERRRHHRKYAHGQLPPHRSFYFTGPNGHLNLRAQNLELFNQIAEGVDDETWIHHLRNHDYSRWFLEMIKDDELYEETRRIENDHRLSARESRKRIRTAIEQRYTASA